MFYFKAVQEEDGSRSLTAWHNGQSYAADDTHPRYDEILNLLVDGDVSAFDIFSVAGAVSNRFRHLSDRITVDNSNVYLDGDRLEDVYADQIVSFLSEGVEDWKPLVKFLERVHSNLNEHTRENLSRWLNSTGGFTITDEGNIIGYKGVRPDLRSIHSGPGLVNGELFTHANLDNSPGNVVEIPRSAVEHNPSVGCAAGLHVGTYSYASGFGSRVVKVEFSPESVVSVPTDCNDEKVRVTRYKVLQEVTSEYDLPVEEVDEAFDYVEPSPDNWLTSVK